jgi:type II secretory pathway pseudopilin PulG
MHGVVTVQRPHGFTYLGLLLWITVTGAGLAAVGTVWHAAAQREREQELLFIGAQFRTAIRQYYEASPGAKQYPQSLEQLLQDPRFPDTRRYLRRIYADPMTGKAQWGLVKQGDWILGVHSLSEDLPVKQALFDAAEGEFTDTRSYSAWRFVYTPEGFQSPGAAAVAGARRPPPINYDTDGNVILTSTPEQSPDANTPRPRSLPTERWVCTANRANQLGECELIAPSGDTGSQKCRQAAQDAYQSCIATALDATPR